MTRPFHRPLVFCLFLGAAAALPCASALADVEVTDPAEVKEDVRAEEAKDLIALRLWVLTVDSSKEQRNDELTIDLGKTASKLPAVVGSRDEVEGLIEKFATGGALRRVREWRIMALAGQTAMSQRGSDEPRVTGSSISARGRTNSLQYQEIGTLVRLTPRIDASDNIVVAIEYSSSETDKSPDVIISALDTESPIFADSITKRQLNTTIRLKSGAAVLVESQSSTAVGDVPSGATSELFILEAAVLPQD